MIAGRDGLSGIDSLPAGRVRGGKRGWLGGVSGGAVRRVQMLGQCD